MLGLIIAAAMIAAALLLIATIALMDRNTRRRPTVCDWCRLRVVRVESHGCDETVGTAEQEYGLLDAPHNN